MSKNSEDIIGQKFGKLVVLARLKTRGIKNSVYECKCDCGNVSQVNRPSLIQGQTKSCGCLQPESTRERKEKICKECSNIYVGTPRSERCYKCATTRTHKKAADARKALKQEMVAAYGGKCVCCGLDDWRFLSIDHINNNGAEERRILNESGNVGGGHGFYVKLRQRGFPKEEYQLLCYNCNMAKYVFGQCPHKESCYNVK